MQERATGNGGDKQVDATGDAGDEQVDATVDDGCKHVDAFSRHEKERGGNTQRNHNLTPGRKKLVWLT